MGSKPDFIAKCRQAPDKDGKESEFFHIIGSAWKWKKGDGYVVSLQLIPTGWDGKFILTPPKADE